MIDLGIRQLCPEILTRSRETLPVNHKRYSDKLGTMVNMPLSYYIIIIIIIMMIHLESPITKKKKKTKRYLGIDNYNPNAVSRLKK